MTTQIALKQQHAAAGRNDSGQVASPRQLLWGACREISEIRFAEVWTLHGCVEEGKLYADVRIGEISSVRHTTGAESC